MRPKFFYLLPILAAALFGYWMGGGAAPKKEEKAVIFKETPHPERDFPLTEVKPFALIVYAYKNAKICERTLKSIFEQEYEAFRVIFIDDASKDGTFEKVQAFVLDNKQDHRVILIQNPERLGPVACLYRASASLHDREIAIPLDVKDWLAHPSVLSRLNAVYQNPDVWAAAAGPILYPSYEKAALASLDNLEPHVPLSFYSVLFKQIRLADLVKKGRFVSSKEAYLRPLLQLSQGRHRILDEPLFIANLARCCRDEACDAVSSYQPLPEFPKNLHVEEKADIVLFSCDRPLQLYACLESVRRYITGFEKVHVLCRARDPRYADSYQKIAQKFPDVHFVFQGKEPKKDFKPLLLKILSDSSSEYVLFGTDDQIVKDFTDLKTCMETMARTGAYGFYLRLGSHITYSYQVGKDQPVPKSVDLGKGIYAWNLQAGFTDWDFPNSVDMTLFRKSALKEPLEKMRYKTPNSLEFCFAKEYPPEQEIGLYFDHSKVVNIPLNVVGRTGNPHMNYLTAAELQTKFEQGLKIDIDPLYRVENSSPHFEYYPEFILR
jgi:glycosyltransferase involved in cell wall biosynthesis